MLKIDFSHITEISEATKISDLFPSLQKAIELEHSTIPPYLTALFSIKTGFNRDIYRSLYNILRDEMLHFTIACNILNALGGQPQIYHPDFVPKYPTTLPLNINNSLVVGLEKLSLNHIKNVFMEIEEPETPLSFPKNESFFAPDTQPQFATIGLFYASIKEKIKELVIEVLPGNPNLQVISNRFRNDELFPIITKNDVLRAIDVIVEQGEGTTKNPIDQFNDLAHYYRFKEITVGRKLIEDDSTPKGYSYSGDDIEFDDTDGVFPIFPNTKIEQLPPESNQRKKAEQFANTYTFLLKELHRTFNSEPLKIDTTLQIMRDLTAIAEELLAMPFPDNHQYNVGPVFEFLELG